MYDVGSDRIALLGHRLIPAGPAHAVDLDGVVLCRDDRPRYHFPSLDWMSEPAPDDERIAPCPACTSIALERALPGDDPYPTEMPIVPAQPAIDWLREPQDFTVWSTGL
jgi:hypothetical protein